MSQEFPASDVPQVSHVPPNMPPDMIQTHEQFINWALKEYERPLISYAQGFVHDWERARDVVQDTFIRLCQQDMAKVRDGVKTWLYTVCRNRALDILRKDSRLVEMEEKHLAVIPTPDASPDDKINHDEIIAELLKCLNRLSPNQREVILLKFQQGLSYEEITRVTGLSSGNVGFLIHHGLKKLREIMPNPFQPTKESY
jgi:RNA polymerase sigma-70 factor (ECF subfamily)